MYVFMYIYGIHTYTILLTYFSEKYFFDTTNITTIVNGNNKEL